MTKTFSSKDFNTVPSQLAALVPEKLKHDDVCNRGDGSIKNDFDEERNHIVHLVDLPTKTISMTIGELEPGQSTRKHRHNYETIIYVIEGEGESKIGDKVVTWQAGDAFYVPIWSWHQHINKGVEKAVYIGCENAPLLQNLGEIALREEFNE